MLTLVTNYPDWADAERQMPSTSERHFGRNFFFILPEAFDVALGDYSKLQIIGDRELASEAIRSSLMGDTGLATASMSSSLWRLAPTSSRSFRWKRIRNEERSSKLEAGSKVRWNEWQERVGTS